MAKSASYYIEKAQDMTVGDAFMNGVAAYILSLSGSLITGTQALFNLLIFPVQALADVSGDVIIIWFLAPMGIVEEGAATSATAVQDFGILGLPIGYVVVLGGFAMTVAYLRWEPSSDFAIIPGIPDAPTDWFGADEDEQ